MVRAIKCSVHGAYIQSYGVPEESLYQSKLSHEKSHSVADPKCRWQPDVVVLLDYRGQDITEVVLQHTRELIQDGFPLFDCPSCGHKAEDCDGDYNHPGTRPAEEDK